MQTSDASRTSSPLKVRTAEDCAEQILSRVGKKIVLGLPVGLGKANSIANALYERAKNDPSIELHIYTALTLARPRAGSDPERRFLDPLFERLAGNYPELAYNEPLQKGLLPANVSVHEFYFPAGRFLNAPLAQQSHTSTNYTHAARDMLERHINVIAQLVSRRAPGEEEHLSLSCNPDITLDLLPVLEQRKAAGEGIAIAGEINDQLPFMTGPAMVEAGKFDLLLDGPECSFDLFQVPKEPVGLKDYAVALHTASLIRDGGTLQLGIGAFSDAFTHALKLRHLRNAEFGQLLRDIGATDAQQAIGGTGVFGEGLYGCSEMLVEGLLELRRNGIIKRRAPGAGKEGRPGPLIHASFFLGSKALYDGLRNLDDEELGDIAMTAVSFVNQLYGDEFGKRADRKHARFINKAMLVTALGAVVSDALEDGRVVSGVGGQYNFVAQAHELVGGRAIIVLDAVRQANGATSSNIVWNYGHTTVPRHLKDMVVTEYGVADLRGKSDAAVVAAMLNITDSRFQDDLLSTAKRAGKIARNYTIPDAHRSNYPQRLEKALRDARQNGLLPAFPLGTEMTTVEVGLVGALKRLKSISRSKAALIRTALAGGLGRPPSGEELAGLERMGLAPPRRFNEYLLRWSLLGAMRAAGDI